MLKIKVEVNLLLLLKKKKWVDAKFKKKNITFNV